MGLENLIWLPVRAGGSISARSAHGMATNGKDMAVVFGGMTTDAEGDPVPLSDVYHLAFEPRAQWRLVHPTGDKPPQREGHSLSFMPSTSLFYLFGGSDDQTQTEFNDLYTYDASGTTWRKLTTSGVAPAPRLNHAAAIVGSNLFIFGGFQDGEARGDLFKFDTRLNKWSSVVAPGAPPARCNHTMVTVGEKLFVIGGRANENMLFSDVHIYDTVANSWSVPSVRGNGPEGRDFHTVVLAGDEKTLVMFGGSREIESKGISIHYNDIQLFDTETSTWSQPTVGGAPPPPRWMHRAVVKDGIRMYVFAGTDEDDYDDLHLLQWDIQAPTEAPSAPVRAPPRKTVPTTAVPARKAPGVEASASPTPAAAAPVSAPGAAPGSTPVSAPVSAPGSTTTEQARPTASAARPAPPTTHAPAPVASPLAQPPSQASSATLDATQTLNLKYEIATAPPAPRKTVSPAKVATAAARNFDEKKNEMLSGIETMFKQLQSEFQKLDTARAELQAERTAFEQEVAEDEATFKKQQTEFRSQLDLHKRETEQWLAARSKEIEQAKAALAGERAQHQKEVAQLHKDQAKLAADTEALEVKVSAFEESRKQMEAIMNRIKGIS
eukprot:m.304884 g.304884  ORF g.304884 m.304884 type:complete len:608 (+) comp55275_c0_seq8:155-1978(+)